jgi:HSP20 family molecular chaperone IbpA
MTQELNPREKEEVRNEEGTRPGRTYQPDVDIFETQESLVLRADVPGVDDSSLAVRLDDGVLSLEGQVDLQDYENLTPVAAEYNIGNYLRRFHISDAIDAEGIAARVTDGVLEVTFPKSAQARPRQIQVTSG